ncbi:ubiquinol oxidase subunit II [Candidatus Schneideria nysicola]|uniref:ubiquinol oxidase subunit II n=1 Tax=Candidatus Schneideria nysicola TaxID=1081631 RepID=UPI001CAA56E2|nr:ubiquinol oxidase subunit II [Candidatus Schneideria nysicola]UAJ64908.1 ubiquinol oxidase subunit II [Candidatus Schneideria nysicola]
MQYISWIFYKIYRYKKNIYWLFPFLLISMQLVSCSNMILLDPKGQIGIEERSLILMAISLMLIVVIPVIIMAILFSIKYRSSNTPIYTPNWSNSNKIELLIWVIPIIIIIFLGMLTWKSSHELDPRKPIHSSTMNTLVIRVVSLDWKWLFIYPEYNIASINEVVFPVNVPIKFEITSNSVMNSFFIPQLGSQIYTMAGMQSILNLMAKEPGIYHGISSNFSGYGFSDMKFIALVTKTNKEFEEWIQKVKLSPKSICDINSYEKIALPSVGHPIEYFSNVYPHLFEQITNKFQVK